MQRYDTYKDSGVKWLGEIPSHWEMRKMKFSFEERSQKGFPNLPLLAATQNHGVIRKTDYENRTVEATKSLDTLKLVEIGDFVISLRSFQGGIELCYEKGIISPAYTILRPTHITAGYFKHLGKSPIFIQLLKSMVTGIREGQNIDYGKLRENLLPIPPIAEQTAIASYLDTATAKIDAAIAQQQKMIDLLNERKQIIIDRAVTKGLNPNAKMKDSGVEWIGEVPEHWEVRRLKYLLRQIAVPSSSLNKIGLENIESGTGKFIKTNSEYEGNGIQFEKGDILYGKLRPYLKKVFLAEESGNAVGDFFVFRPNDIVEGKYMQLVLLSQTLTDEINSSTYGAKMPRVSIDFMGGLNIPSPSLDEQKEIVETIHKNCKPIDDAISAANNQISLLQERKQIVINEVVTGKVKVV